jgi:VWFA-related protein
MRSSLEARRLVIRSGVAHTFCFLLCVTWFLIHPAPAVAQAAAQPAPTQAAPAQAIPAQSAAAPSPTPPSESTQNVAEVASHDEPATFRVNVKLVVVRAVVRDSAGHAIGNLHQDDFQVFDKGKLQVITQFEVEQPGALAAKVHRNSEENSGNSLAGDIPSTPGNELVTPERFVAYVFDDVHLEFGDLAQVRQAAERNLDTLRPTDRAAIFTTSGQKMLDFTDDRAKLREALLRLLPHSIGRGAGQDCPDISYYQADLIINKNDVQATQAALQDTMACNPDRNAQTAPAVAAAMIQSASSMALSAGDQESRVSLGVLNDVVRNVSRMPGQRSVVLVSPGFITPRLEFDYNQIIDHAVRSQVVINTLDARGLYVPYPFADASLPAPRSGDKSMIEIAAQSANDDLLAVLADSTGGVFFHNNNDFNEGFRRVAETPEYSYVLAFTPQNLKLDGSFHSLKVTLKNAQKLSLQARRGYYAPKTFADPEEQAKQEIEDEMFSQEELHNLPVKLHTQFFKGSDQDATLVVLAHVDVRRLRFRKVEGRNENVLTCVSALFNRNGNFIQGTQKVVTMHFLDDTLEHKLASGLTLKTSFDVKPGSYVVRLVVRDSEGQSMSAENGTVEIR